MEYRWFEMLTRDYGLSEAEAKRIGEEMFDNEIWVQGLDGGRLSLEEAIHQYELKYPDDVDVMGWFLRNGEQMAVKRPEVWDKVAALKEKGYDPINQIVGYILSEDPTYITNHNGARTLICKVDRDELLQVLVKNYLEI